MLLDAPEELDAELEEDDLLELEEDATRLVEARNADERLDPPELLDDAPGLEFDCDALELTLALTVVELAAELLPRSRPNPDRLPRICGLSMDAKFSAAVTPVSRRVACTSPVDTTTVLMVVAVVAACWATFRRASVQ